MGDVYSLPMFQQKAADVLVERCRRFGWMMPTFHAWDADVPGVRRRRFSVYFINV